VLYFQLLITFFFLSIFLFHQVFYKLERWQISLYQVDNLFRFTLFILQCKNNEFGLWARGLARDWKTVDQGDVISASLLHWVHRPATVSQFIVFRQKRQLKSQDILTVFQSPAQPACPQSKFMVFTLQNN